MVVILTPIVLMVVGIPGDLLLPDEHLEIFDKKYPLTLPALRQAGLF